MIPKSVTIALMLVLALALFRRDYDTGTRWLLVAVIGGMVLYSTFSSAG